MDRAGALESRIREHLRGGRAVPATTGSDDRDTTVMLRGGERATYLTLDLGDSLRATRGPDSGGDSILVEVNARHVGSEMSGDWMQRVFQALCSALDPRLATASTLGETAGAIRRYDDRSNLAWLTYFGSEEVATYERDRLLSTPGAIAKSVGDGVLLRFGDDPGPGRRSPYWRLIDAATEHLDADNVRATMRRRRRAELRPAVVQEASTNAAPALEMPVSFVDGDGTRHLVGHTYRNQRFRGQRSSDGGLVLEGFTFERCVFDNCSLGSLDDRSTEPVIIRSSTVVRCKGRAVFLGWVVVEDCLIDGWSGGAYPTDEPLFRRVTVRGNIDAIDVRHPRQLRRDRSDRIARHEAFYADVEWALDIREARFRRCDISGVPGRLVRRDPSTQILVTRERLARSRWQDLGYLGTSWRVGFERMLDAGIEDRVYVAEPRGKDFVAQLALIGILREAGIAEPD